MFVSLSVSFQAATFVINIFTNHIVPLKAPGTIAQMETILTKSLSVSSLRGTLASDA